VRSEGQFAALYLSPGLSIVGYNPIRELGTVGAAIATGQVEGLNLAPGVVLFADNPQPFDRDAKLDGISLTVKPDAAPIVSEGSWSECQWQSVLIIGEDADPFMVRTLTRDLAIACPLAILACVGT